jgi:hypothetical protein
VDGSGSAPPFGLAGENWRMLAQLSRDRHRLMYSRHAGLLSFDPVHDRPGRLSRTPPCVLEIGFERDEFIREWLCNLGIGEAPSSDSNIATFATLRAHGKVM